MKIQIVLILIFGMSLMACQETVEQSEPSAQLYPKALKFGDYQVGYQTIWTYDITRPSIPYANWNGKLYPTQETKGRQFQINIWYPTLEPSNEQRMTIGDYEKLLYRQIDFEESQTSIDFGKNELITKLKDLGGFENISVDNLDTLENLSSKAFHNAKPINEKFPLILYPNGMAPFTNSIGAEYLSSQGFVVVGFMPKGQNKSTEDISSRGADVVADDIKFILSEVLKLPNVNAENIGIMANAIESSYCVGYQVKNRTLKSIVSLEGGFLSNFEQTILEDLPFYEPQNLDIPLLAIYSPHPSINPNYIEHLKYSQRYLAHFPNMREYDYLNYGMYNNLIPNIIGEPRGDITPSYVKAHEIIKDFFEHTLKRKNPNFDKEFISIESTVSDSTYIWGSIPNIPTMSEVKNNFISNGFSYMDSLYEAQKKFTSQPFSKNFIKDYRDWVSWKKDPDYKTRKGLYEFAVESYPNSALINYHLALYSLKSGDSTFSRKNYQQTIEKLKTDTDEELTKDVRTIIKQQSNKQIKALTN